MKIQRSALRPGEKRGGGRKEGRREKPVNLYSAHDGQSKILSKARNSAYLPVGSVLDFLTVGSRIK